MQVSLTHKAQQEEETVVDICTTVRTVNLTTRQDTAAGGTTFRHGVTVPYPTQTDSRYTHDPPWIRCPTMVAVSVKKTRKLSCLPKTYITNCKRYQKREFGLLFSTYDKPHHQGIFVWYRIIHCQHRTLLFVLYVTIVKVAFIYDDQASESIIYVALHGLL